MISSFSRQWLSLGLLLCSSAILACAQSTSAGSVSGQVTDPQNAVIAGAEVRLTDVQTNIARNTVTNETGRYSFSNVTPGSYDITFTKPGFSQSKISGQAVEVGLTLTANITLQVGSTSTTVEVTTGAEAELQTVSATVGSTISAASLQLLPNLGRDASALSVLQVGVMPTGNVA